MYQNTWHLSKDSRIYKKASIVYKNNWTLPKLVRFQVATVASKPIQYWIRTPTKLNSQFEAPQIVQKIHGMKNCYPNSQYQL